MHDDLIHRLRAAGKESFIYSSLLQEAADAIEELRKLANKLLAKYQEEATSVICEYSGNVSKSLDLLDKEVRTLMAQIDGMPLPEPPKEE